MAEEKTATAKVKALSLGRNEDLRDRPFFKNRPRRLACVTEKDSRRPPNVSVTVNHPLTSHR